jgi:chromosome segregation ATPase
MKNVLTPARGAILATLVVGFAAPSVAQGLDRAIATGEQATRRAEQVQQQINQLDDERADMVGEFRTLLQRKTAAELYARQQEAAVESQQREIASLTDQLSRVDEITSQTVPMLETLIDDLDAFIDADLPFRLEDRKARIERLRGYLSDPAISVTERYRQIMDAYTAEMEVGRKTDTWKETITVDDKEVTVDMVLFGRVAMVYMDPTGRYAKRYDRETQSWVDLESKYKAEIEKAIRIIQGKRTQDVMYVPATKLAVQ